ncbi:MAG: MOSC N-terminal beta barrel domain-containing protein [Roseobacter sp.]
MTSVTTLLRYPLKSHGREALDQIQATAGQSLPFDRMWAVAHTASKADGSVWAPCANFSRVSKAPALMAITAKLDEPEGLLTLSHPEKEDLTFDPDASSQAFIDWVMPLVDQDRALPERIIKLPGRGFTDSDFPSVTLCNLASHRAVEKHMGHDLSMHRWRGNVWFDADVPWVEFDWLGKDVRIGEAIVRVRERTDRCLATTANPSTGKRDADTLAALKHWGHQDFSVRAEIVQSGLIRTGDKVELL